MAVMEASLGQSLWGQVLGFGFIRGAGGAQAARTGAAGSFGARLSSLGRPCDLEKADCLA